MLFWILLMLLATTMFALAVVIFFPKWFLKNRYPIERPTDRGVKKYKFTDSDYAIVYEPSLESRKFITQYVLAKKDGKKTIKCKTAPGITYVDYDIVLFNCRGKCFLVMNSVDAVKSDRVTEETELPDETAFVSIIINQANDDVIERADGIKTKNVGIIPFGFFTLLASVAMSFCVVFSLSHIFGGLFKETFPIKMISSGWIFIVPTILSAICIGMACVILSFKNKKR